MFLALLAIGCVDYELSRRTMVDSYVQSSRQAGVDILWVVDNSASAYTLEVYGNRGIHFYFKRYLIQHNITSKKLNSSIHKGRRLMKHTCSL